MQSNNKGKGKITGFSSGFLSNQFVNSTSSRFSHNIPGKETILSSPSHNSAPSLAKFPPITSNEIVLFDSSIQLSNSGLVDQPMFEPQPISPPDFTKPTPTFTFTGLTHIHNLPSQPRPNFIPLTHTSSLDLIQTQPRTCTTNIQPTFFPASTTITAPLAKKRGRPPNSTTTVKKYGLKNRANIRKVGKPSMMIDSLKKPV